MSLNGQTQTYMPPTLDGLNIVEADQIYVNGVELDPNELVTYTGATKALDMNSKAIKTTYTPIVNADVTNKLYVDGAVSIGSGDTLGIVNLNFVRYSGSISDTDLGTYKISSSAVPATANHLTNKTYVDTQDATRVPYTGATSNVVLTGTNKFQQAYNATTSDTTTVVNRQTLDAAIAGLGAGILNLNNTWGYGNTNDINGGMKTLQNPMQYNSSLDANSYFVVGVSPTTYIFSGNWIINPVAGTTANISLDSALFYFSTSIKYVITFTGIYGTSGSWVGTVFNNTTSTTVSDASIAITTTSQTLSMTFTPGSNNPTIYLRFVGASGTLRWTNFTIKEVDAEVMGNLIIDSQINSNITQANGKTTNLANALKVNQTSIATASSLTTASLPAGVSASTLSGSYTLTATAGGTTFGMWLGSSFTYTAGSKYTYTFTGFSTNATATQAMILYTNTYTGGSGTMIGDYVVNVPITSSTVSGSFTATSNNNVVWNFVASATGKSISFSGFTLTRADTEITGIITATGIATGTPATTIGLNSSNQLIKYANPTIPSNNITGTMTTNYLPLATGTYTLGDSIMSQSGTQLNIAGSLYASNDITAGYALNCVFITSSGGYVALDDRSLRPKDISPGAEQFFFGSWNNDGASPFADCIGMNSWTDNSGGNTNVLMVRKDTYGIRQYQGTFGSTTAFTSAQYMDCCMKGVGDNSVTYFGPNATWSTRLVVGAGTDKGDTGTAQVLCTDGNLHLDSSTSHNIYLGYHRNPVNIYNYASGGITNYVRYHTQTVDVNGDAGMYIGNNNNGTSANTIFTLHSSAGNTIHFMNSSTRAYDGGVNTYTIRNDTSGGVRFLGPAGGFSSYGNNGGSMSYNTNAVVNYTNTTNDGGTGWNNQGYTLFCNASTPAINQPALALGCSNTGYASNRITSLWPGVVWTPLNIHAGTIAFFLNGIVVGYTVPSGGSNVSDEREKHDIKDLKTSRSLERILKCKPKYYRRKYYDFDADGKPTTPAPQSAKDAICIGLVAQDVKEHNPHCISTWKNDNIKETECDDGTRFGVNYGDYTIHLIGAVQEQQKQIDLLLHEVKQGQEAQRAYDDLKKKLEKSQQDFDDYKKTMEARFDKLATMLQALGQSK